MIGLREIIEEVEEYQLNRRLTLDRLKKLETDIIEGWKAQLGQIGPTTEFDLGYAEACGDIIGKIGKKEISNANHQAD